MIILSGPLNLDFSDVFDIRAEAVSGNFYMINGKSVHSESVEDPGTGMNNEYVKSLYKYIWGMEYTDDFSSSDNILKNMLYEERLLNEENLKSVVQRCQPGSVMKVETVNGMANGSGSDGFAVMIVNKDNNGFSVFERTDERKETYYTWNHFCEIYKYSTIKYLKWPNSYFVFDSQISETDYKKPDRSLYYDKNEALTGDDVKWVQQMLVNAGFSVPVNGYFGKNTEAQVKAFQKEFSINVTGIVDDVTANMLEFPIKCPDALKISLKNIEDAHLSIGDILTVVWDEVQYADSYCISLYNNRGNLIETFDNVKGTEASFVIENSGTYTVKGYAKNDRFNGEVSVLESKIKVHNTFTVKFLDEDGTLLNKQTVPYGMDAATPASPKKTGHLFIGWDNEYTNVTSNITAKAKYVKKSFTVSFCDPRGNLIGEPQKVMFGESATAPDTSSIEGFVGWNKDFSFIEKSITVRAVALNNEISLPATIKHSNASRAEESSGYRVNFTVANNTEDRVEGRAIVALKTTAGKFLTMTESSAFVLKASDLNSNTSSEKTMSVFVPYSGAATIVEIYIVENYNDLVPISSVSRITEINTDSNFTDWISDEEAAAAGLNTLGEDYFSTSEYRTEYSYRTKEKKESGSSTLAGWTKYDTKITSYNYSGWSSWSASPINATDLREVKTKTESYENGRNIRYWATQSYNSPYYRHYWNYNHGPERASYGQWTQSKWVSLSEWNNYTQVLSGARSAGTYNGFNKVSATGRYDWQGYIWYDYEKTYGSTTYYQYQDRYPVYTYYFYRWNDWSDWSTTPQTGTDDIEVRTRLTRQYEVNDPTESNVGKTRTIAGAVDKSLAGKQATLFIYKIGDASDYTNEYVGQTMIDESGSYKFSFKMREEPSVDTGDYCVTLGVEGTNTVFEIEPIKAPLKEYTVNICDYDGTIIDSQKVKKGGSAVLPTVNPERPGYTFAGWNYSNASIYEDTNIMALYVQDEYTVVFIDWTNETFEMQTGLHYGDLLTAPSLNRNDKYVDVSGNTLGVWKDVTEGMTVTKNMVITAEYEEKTFNVNFYDYDKNLISTQKVNYGESAVEPELDTNDEYMFISWDNYDFNFVDSDIDVNPVYCFAKSTEKPVVNIKSGTYSNSQSLTLTCKTNSATIFYSINDSEYRVYTNPITIDSSSKVTYFASALGYNDSEKSNAYYAINKAGDNENWKHLVKIYRGNTIVDMFLIDANQTIDSYYSSLNKVSDWTLDTEVPEGAEIKDTKYTYTIEIEVVNPQGGLTHNELEKESESEPDGLLASNIKKWVKYRLEDNSIEGYNIDGYYLDSEFKDSWDIKTDVVRSELNLYIKDSIKNFKVDFKYEDGRLIESKTAEYLKGVNAPENISVNEDEVFIGWDTNSYSCVTENMVITAIIRNKNETPKVELNNSHLTMITGMSYDLVATVTPEAYVNETVKWSSDNNDVVVVENGKITAVSSGKATITATLINDIVFKDECTVTVYPNKSEEICLVKDSELKIVNGKLLGILPENNSVELILDHIDSDEVIAYSSEGKLLKDSDLIETGGILQLVDNLGVIHDVITVVVVGDVNCDGNVSNKDASMLMRYLVNKEQLNEVCLNAADTNSDGYVSVQDIAILQQYLIGMKITLS